MKKLFYLLITGLLLSLSFCTTTFAGAEESLMNKPEDMIAKPGKKTDLDGIVAVVNDDVVTQSELDHAVTMIQLQMAQANATLPSPKEMQEQMLDQLINKKLQLQIAKQAGVTVSEEDIDKAVENIAKQNNIPVKELYEHVREEGMSKTDYRGELQKQLTLQKLQQQEVMSHITITPSEVKRFEAKKSWKQYIPVEKEYQIEDILVPIADNASTHEIDVTKKRALALLTRLRKQHVLSEGEQKGITKTDMGYRKLADLPSAFVPYVTNLNPKEIAGPIQTGNGFHMLRLVDERPLGNKNQVEPNHKQIEQLVYQHKIEEAMQTWLSKLRSQAFIVTHPT